jgi:hypothetical protein
MQPDDSRDFTVERPGAKPGPARRRSERELVDATSAELARAAAAGLMQSTPLEPVPILLDRLRHLRMDFRGMRAFKKQTGLSPWGREAWTDADPDILLALLWASLIHEDPELAIEDVERMPGVDMGNIGYLTERLGRLWGASMPEPEPQNGHVDPNLVSPTQTRTG